MTLTLGNCSQAQVPINVSFEGNSLTISLTRNHFERLTSDLLHRTRDATQRVFSQAGIQADQLDDVVLVGRSTHMPQVKSMLAELCSRQPFQKLNPNVAAAQGAAIHAAIYAANGVQQDN